MRLKHDPLANEKLNNSKFLINSASYQMKRSTILEIGMGKGDMIVNMAKNNPQNNYIGVEKFATVAVKAAIKAREAELTNFKIICQDVKKIPEIIKGKAQVIWLTFSDPWPKNRHEKRRLTYKFFLQIYFDLLNDDGVIKLKTDNDAFFNYSIESMQAFGFKLSNVTNDLHKNNTIDNQEMTAYEHKWAARGKNINYLEARKDL